METESFNSHRIQQILTEVIEENQDRAFGNEIKSLFSNENELMEGARFLFRKASLDLDDSLRCAKLAEALADVTITNDKNRLQTKNFRDCIVELSIDVINDFKINDFVNDEPFTKQQAGLIKFIVLLHQEQMLSDVFIEYWSKSLQSAENRRAANFFIESIRKIRNDKAPEIDLLNHKASSQSPKALQVEAVKSLESSQTLQNQIIYKDFEQFVNKISLVTDPSFDFIELKPFQANDVTMCAVLLFDKISVETNSAVIRKFGAILVQLNTVFPSNYRFIRQFIELCESKLKDRFSIQDEKNIRWVEIIGIGLILSELYNFNLVKKSLMNLWMDKVNELTIKMVQPAANAMLLTFKICAEKMEKRDEKKYNDCMEVVKELLDNNSSSSQQKQMAQEVLQILNVLVTAKAEEEPAFENETVEQSKEIIENSEFIRDFQKHLNKSQDTAENFVFEDYEIFSNDIDSCASIIIEAAIKQTNRLEMIKNLTKSIFETKYHLEFRRSLISVCKSRIDNHLLEGTSTEPLAKVLGEFFNFDVLPAMTVKLMLQTFSNLNHIGSYQILTKIISAKALRRQDRCGSAMAKSLKEIVENNQCHQMEAVSTVNQSNEVKSSELNQTMLITYDLNLIVDKLAVENLKEIARNLNLVKPTMDSNLVQKLREVLARKAVEQPNLCYVIISLCHEIYELEEFLEQMKAMKRILNSEFSSCFNGQPLKVSSQHVMKILHCSLVMSSVFDDRTQILESQIATVLNYARTDDDVGLPILVEFIKFVELYFPDKIILFDGDITLFLWSRLHNSTIYEDIRLCLEITMNKTKIEDALNLTEKCFKSQKMASTSSLPTDDHDESDMIGVLRSLKPANIETCKQTVSKIDDLELLEKCSGILLEKAIKYPGKIMEFVKILQKISGGKKADKAARETVRRPIETAIDNLFDKIEKSKLKTSVETAVTMMSYVGEGAKRMIYGMKFNFKCLQVLYTAACEGNVDNINLLVIFVDKISQIFLTANEFPIQIFEFLIDQSSNEKLSKQSRIKLEKSIDVIQILNEELETAPSTNDVLLELNLIVKDVSTSTFDEIKYKLEALNFDLSPFDEDTIEKILTKLMDIATSRPDSAMLTVEIITKFSKVSILTTSQKKAKAFRKDRLTIMIVKLFDSIFKNSLSLSSSENIMNLACCLNSRGQIAGTVISSFLSQLLVHPLSSTIKNTVILTFFQICGNRFFKTTASYELRDKLFLQLKQSRTTSAYMNLELTAIVKHLESESENSTENPALISDWIKLAKITFIDFNASDYEKSSNEESIEEITRKKCSLEGLKAIIKNFDAHSIEDLKKEVGIINRLKNEELKAFVSFFHDVAAKKVEILFYVGLAQIIHENMSNNKFKNELTMHVVAESSKILVLKSNSNEDLQTSVQNYRWNFELLGELYNIGWIHHICVTNFIEELAAFDPGEFKFQLLLVLIKTVAYTIKDSLRVTKCYDLHKTLQLTLKEVKNTKTYLIVREVLKFLSIAGAVM